MVSWRMRFAPRHLRRPAVLIALALIGCGGANRLETGYAYRPLGSNVDERRAFYANRFSAEARRAAQAEDGPQRQPAGPRAR